MTRMPPPRADHDPSSELRTAPDEVLVRRAADGDTVAFGVLVRRHAPLLRAYSARIVGSLSEADDVVQETFVTAWRRLPALRDPSAFKAWLMRIGTRRALQVVARRPATAELSDDLPGGPALDPETAVIRSAQLMAVAAALDRLPADQRRCWLLRELGELSYQQIAEELGITPAQVRGKLARARASMAVQMEGWR